MVGWPISVGTACAVAALLFATGLLKSSDASCTRTVDDGPGMVLQILRDSGELESGWYVMGVTAVAEFGPSFLASLMLAHLHSHVMQTFLTILFLIIACAGGG
jgi:hypothetical protein